MTLLPGVGGAVGEHDPAVALHVPHAGEVVGHPGPVLERLQLMQPLPGHHEASVNLLNRLLKQKRERDLQTGMILIFCRPQICY